MTLQEKLANVPIEKDFFAGLSKEDIEYEKIMGKIAGRIILERTKQHLSQEELAKKLGVKQSLISKWESGDNNFTFKQVVKIFAALDLDVDITFGKGKEPSESYHEIPSSYMIKQQIGRHKIDENLYAAVLQSIKSKEAGEIAS